MFQQLFAARSFVDQHTLHCWFNWERAQHDPRMLLGLELLASFVSESRKVVHRRGDAQAGRRNQRMPLDRLSQHDVSLLILTRRLGARHSLLLQWPSIFAGIGVVAIRWAGLRTAAGAQVHKGIRHWIQARRQVLNRKCAAARIDCEITRPGVDEYSVFGQSVSVSQLGVHTASVPV